jgi:predicted nicotinamide N-methyase
MTTPQHDWPAFIRDNTKIIAPPLVPEIVLHLAEESLPIWRRTEEELGAMNVPPPYWAFAWAGGQAVSRYILDNPALVAGKRVLDLGAGSGLAAIAAAKARAAEVIAADIDAVSLGATLLNAASNNVMIATTAQDLLATPPTEPFDVVIVGDLFYERALADSVMTFIDGALKQGALILIGDPQRSYFPRGRFEKLTEYRVPVTRELEDSEIKLTAVWKAT